MAQNFLTDNDVRKLRDIARRVGSGGTSQRPIARRRRNPGGSAEQPLIGGPIEFVIRETVSPATWVGSPSRLVPVTFVTVPFEPVPGDDRYRMADDVEENHIRVISYFTTPIEVGEGKGRVAIGYVVNEKHFGEPPWDELEPPVTVKLFNVDCEEIQL